VGISVERQKSCPLCGGAARPRFDGLVDGLWGVAGKWSVKECARCEALWLDPRPSPKDIGKAYSGYYTHEPPGGAKGVALRAARKIASRVAALRFREGMEGKIVRWTTDLSPWLAELMDLSARYLPRRRERALLDVGCGDGTSLDWLRNMGWDAKGCEIDPAAVEAARKRGFDVVQGTAADFPDQTFDVVTSSHVLEHVHDPKEFLEECRRILRPGGQVVAITPNTRSPLLEEHGRHWVQLDAPRHLILFNEDNLRDLAESVGFSEVTIRRTGRGVFWSHIASTLLKRLGRYDWSGSPGLRLRLEGMMQQRRVSRAVRRGGQGEELVLIGTR
jgi:SAM-dependent methyltransferase